MKRAVLLLFLLSLLSCEERPAASLGNEFLVVPCSGKLEKLLGSSRDSVFDYCDLSDDRLMDFPDLSGYTIRSLNLSHNYLDTLNLSFLPEGLEVLNLSHNYLWYLPELVGPIREWKDLDLSHNRLISFSLYFFIDRLNLSYNDLDYIYIYSTYGDYVGFYSLELKKKFQRRMSYLNISHNPRLSNKVWFVPSRIDTVIRDHIANDKKLEMISIIPRLEYFWEVEE